jgi:hypothetical protein
MRRQQPGEKTPAGALICDEQYNPMRGYLSRHRVGTQILLVLRRRPREDFVSRLHLSASDSSLRPRLGGPHRSQTHTLENSDSTELADVLFAGAFALCSKSTSQARQRSTRPAKAEGRRRVRGRESKPPLNRYLLRAGSAFPGGGLQNLFS